MMLLVDPDSAVAPYAQLRQQLALAIARGELEPGSKLPTVRRLAADLGIAPNTVARTYFELERVGLIETQGRRGTFVAQVPANASTAAATAEPAASAEVASTAQLDQALAAAGRFVTEIRSLGFDDAMAVRLVQRTLNQAV